MTAIGMETFLSRPVNRSPLDAERAATANNVGADLMISLRCEAQKAPPPAGVASFHFGNSHGSVSTIGRNLADFIQREVVARTGLRDCRTHGRTWDLLRLTRMPTVQVDVGYVTNPHDRAMLVSTQTRDAIAEESSPRSSGSTCWAKTTVPQAHSLSPSYWPTNCRWSAPARWADPEPHRPLVGRGGFQCVRRRGRGPDRLLEAGALQQTLQRRLDFGLPPETLVELEP